MKNWEKEFEKFKNIPTISYCTRGKNCTGSLDGKKYHYKDGSVDYGILGKGIGESTYSEIKAFIRDLMESK